MTGIGPNVNQSPSENRQPQDTTIIRFGHCQLFTNRRELFVDGAPVLL